MRTERCVGRFAGLVAALTLVGACGDAGESDGSGGSSGSLLAGGSGGDGGTGGIGGDGGTGGKGGTGGGGGTGGKGGTGGTGGKGGTGGAGGKGGTGGVAGTGGDGGDDEIIFVEDPDLGTEVARFPTLFSSAMTMGRDGDSTLVPNTDWAGAWELRRIAKSGEETFSNDLVAGGRDGTLIQVARSGDRLVGCFWTSDWSTWRTISIDDGAGLVEVEETFTKTKDNYCVSLASNGPDLWVSGRDDLAWVTRWRNPTSGTWTEVDRNSYPPGDSLGLVAALDAVTGTAYVAGTYSMGTSSSRWDVRRFDTATSKFVSEELGPSFSVLVRFAANGGRIAVVALEDSGLVLRAKRAAGWRTFPLSGEQPRGIALTPDGRVFVSVFERLDADWYGIVKYADITTSGELEWATVIRTKGGIPQSLALGEHHVDVQVLFQGTRNRSMTQVLRAVEGVDYPAP